MAYSVRSSADDGFSYPYELEVRSVCGGVGGVGRKLGVTGRGLTNQKGQSSDAISRLVWIRAVPLSSYSCLRIFLMIFAAR